MEEMRDVYRDPAHPLRGPYLAPTASFAPLRLRLEPERKAIVVNQPRAVVGRHSGADVRLAFPEISRYHCQLAFEQGEWRVHDLNSLNGVFVNEERCAEAVLAAGDRLRLGPIVLVVEGAAVECTRRVLTSNGREQVLRQIAKQLPPEPPLAA
jgi:pSer/pThr/pTyr-binding forkhead associated (FHA) protein